MSRLIVSGGNRICGKLKWGQNSALPILAATVLNGGINVIHDIPKLLDVDIMEKILISLGCSVKEKMELLL